MNPTLLLVLFFADAIAVALGVLYLRRARAASAIQTVLATLAYCAVACAVAFFGSAPFVYSGFAQLQALEHGVFFVSLPLIGYAGFLLCRRPGATARISGAAGLLVFVLGSAAYVHARFIEPFDLEISYHEIATGRIDRPIKIVVLSDLQCEEVGAYERDVFRRIAEERADLLLLPGDFLQAKGEQYDRERIKLVDEFKKLPKPRFGTWAVFGDSDHSDVTLAGTGIPVLGHETRILDPESRLALVTMDTNTCRHPLRDTHFDPLGDFDGFPIVMGHAPDYMNNVLMGHVRREMLCVAGHTHGGQVNIPGFGPPMTLSRVPRWLAAGGLFQKHEAWLLVSRGVGMERKNAPRIRFNCRPELVVVTLLPKTS